jgi:hypothetical protein
MKSSLSILMGLINLAMASYAAAEQGQLPIASRTNQIVDEVTDGHCGPRAVKRILDWYGINEDLHVLSAEIQPLINDRSSSMASLALALRKRSITTSAFEIGRSVRIESDRPVLVHLSGSNGYTHFAVLLPRESSRSVGNSALAKSQKPNLVWMGPGDSQFLSDREFGRIRSGAVLLTGTLDSAAAEACFRRLGSLSALGIHDILLAAVPMVSLVVMIRSLKRWRSKK